MKLERFGISIDIDDKSLLSKWAKKNWVNWELEESKFIFKCVDKNKVFIEVGAWIAPYSILFSKVFKKCIAIEPDIRSIEDIKMNIKYSNIKNIDIIGFGVSDKLEYIKLSNCGANSGSSIMLNGGKSKEITTYPLKYLIFHVKPSEIGCICMDIEGAEYRVLPAFKEYMVNFKPPMLISYHPNILKNEQIQQLKLMMSNIYRKIDIITPNVYFYT